MAEVKDLQACQSDEHLFEQAGSEVFHMVAGLVAKDAEAQAVPSKEHCKPRPHHFLLFWPLSKWQTPASTEQVGRCEIWCH